MISGELVPAVRRLSVSQREDRRTAMTDIKRNPASARVDFEKKSSSPALTVDEAMILGPFIDFAGEGHGTLARYLLSEPHRPRALRRLPVRVAGEAFGRGVRRRGIERRKTLSSGRRRRSVRRKATQHGRRQRECRMLARRARNPWIWCAGRPARSRWCKSITMKE